MARNVQTTAASRTSLSTQSIDWAVNSSYDQPPRIQSKIQAANQDYTTTEKTSAAKFLDRNTLSLPEPREVLVHNIQRRSITSNTAGNCVGEGVCGDRSKCL